MSGWLTPGSRIRRHLPLAFLLLAFLPIIANGLVALLAIDELQSAGAWVQRALQAMSLLKQAEDLSEGGSRDLQMYHLFRNPADLEWYSQSQSKLPDILRQLRQAIPDDMVSVGRFTRLSSLIEQDRDDIAMLPLSPDISAPSIAARLASDARRTRSIMATIDQLLRNEERLLDERVRVITSRNTVIFGTIVLSAAGSVGLVGVIFIMLQRDVRRSERLAETHSGALRESEQRFRRIFEESPLGMLLADADSAAIMEANPAFCRMLGLGGEYIVGRTIVELAHIDDRDVLHEAIQVLTVPAQGITVRYVTRTGAIAWASIHLTPLSAYAGPAGLLLVLAEDVTSEKRVEAELRQAQKMEAIGQLTGGIAHDFNNLLGVIIGNVEFVIDGMQTPGHAAMAREILDSALSGADLTRRLLAFARRQSLQPRLIDLNIHLPGHIAILRRLLGESITITTRLADNLWPTRADPSQVGDALLNLGINARDAMPHGGVISIETANVHVAPGQYESEMTADDYVVLSVRDTGIGMPPEVLERVVEPFFTTKGPGSGSGLGLSMIFGFAKQSGGHLRIDSKLGQGTTVRLYLPRAQGSREVEEFAAPEAPEGVEAILLVDDNVAMRTVTRRHLHALGYRVSEADCGPTALSIMQAGQTFDLLFTDIVMPHGMSGYQLAAAAQLLQPGLRVLFTTGYSRREFEGGSTAMPTATVLRKPYRRHELALSVRAALEPQAALGG